MDAKLHVYAAILLGSMLVAGIGAFAYGWLRIRAGMPGGQGAMVLAAFAIFAVLLLGLFYLAPDARRGVVFMALFLWLLGLPTLLLPLWPGRDAPLAPTSAAPTANVAPLRLQIPPGDREALSSWMDCFADGSSVVGSRYADAATARARIDKDRRVPGTLGRISGWRDGYSTHHMFVTLDGDTLYTWFADDEDTLRRHVEAAGGRPSTMPAATPPRPRHPGWGTTTRPGPIPIALFAGYVVVVALVFIRAAAWLSTWPPTPGTTPLQAGILRAQLLALDQAADLPFEIRPGTRDDEIIVDWRYADATWFDLMRAHRVTHINRYVMRLSPGDHTVRVRGYQADFDASAGLGGLNLSFRATWGQVTFFERRTETVFGVQIKNGRPTRDLSYTWHFDIEEMRAPLLETVRDAGWSWKSVPLFAPLLTG